jgi:hypothetical protein
MRSIRTNQEFGGLWTFLGVTIKVLEVLKSPWIQGFRSDGPGEASNTIYWPETLFSGGTTRSCEFTSPLATISKVESSSIVPRRYKEEGGQGVGAPVGPAAAKAPRAAGGAAALHRYLRQRLLRLGRRLSPLGGTSRSLSTTPLHHLHCNLLETRCLM